MGSRDRRHAGGVNSNTRLLGPKIVIERGAGGRIWDVDGNEYIDLLLGQGPAFLVTAITLVHEAVARGKPATVLSSPPPNPREIEGRRASAASARDGRRWSALASRAQR